MRDSEQFLNFHQLQMLVELITGALVAILVDATQVARVGGLLASGLFPLSRLKAAF